MTTKALRVAILGCGKMGIHHVRAVVEHGVGQLVAVADPSVDRETVVPALPPGTAIYTDVEEMLTTVRPDVVHVVTPPHSHAQLAMLALNHGAHVYVEKPFCLTRTEAEAVTNLADRKQLRVCAGHQLLFQESGRQLKDYATVLGDLVHIESYFSFKTVRKAADGRGAMPAVDQLLDILPHPVYLLMAAMTVGDGADSSPGLPELQALTVDADGDVHAIIRRGKTTGLLVVTLRGRPIESYLKVVGTNGTIHADFILSGVAKLFGPGASAISVVLKPYSMARQLLFNTTRNIVRMIVKRHKGYAGLGELVTAFHRCVIEGTPSPVSPQSINATVALCESIGRALKDAEAVAEQRAAEVLGATESTLAPPDKARGYVLVTGGSGFLGREVVAELRGRGWPVRVLARRIPSAAVRVPGVEYVRSDVADALDPEVCRDVSCVVHLAAETAGGKEAHERNTLQATRNVLTAAGQAGIRRFINISSIAVLTPGRRFGAALREDSTVDADNLGRGPYVWAKAEAERTATVLSAEYGMEVRTIRLGPLTDFRSFTPPGRLGREVGPWFVAVGSKRSAISLCDVQTAARVIRAYVEDFGSAPPVLNLVEPDAPKRGDLVNLLLKRRPDLKVLWLPMSVLRPLSFVAKLLQYVFRPGKKPLDIAAAFASERYDTALAETVISRARRSSA